MKGTPDTGQRHRHDEFGIRNATKESRRLPKKVIQLFEAILADMSMENIE